MLPISPADFEAAGIGLLMFNFKKILGGGEENFGLYLLPISPADFKTAGIVYLCLIYFLKNIGGGGGRREL